MRLKQMRAFEVCLPPQVRHALTSMRRVRLIIGAVLVFSVLYNAPHFFEAVLLECWHPQFKAASVEVCPAPFRFNPT